MAKSTLEKVKATNVEIYDSKTLNESREGKLREDINRNIEPFEEKYNILYDKYIKLKSERDNLRKTFEELKIHNELTNKITKATKPITKINDGFEMKHALIVVLIGFLLGVIFMKA